MKDKILNWFGAGQVGASSKAMALAAAGMPNDKSHPYDPDDLNRCLLLLEAVPEIRQHMDKVAAIVRATLANCWWGADQYALFKAFIEARPEIFFLGPEWADVEQSHDGVIWFTAADAKARLKTDETPYARLFRHYWAMRP